MSRRNMSERAIAGLMLCEINVSGYPSGGYPSSSSEENRNLGILNGLVQKGVSDENKFRPLTQLLQNIGKSNTDGSTPRDTTALGEDSTKLFLAFMEEAAPPTCNPEADKAKAQKVLAEMQETFGLSDKQVEGLQKKLDDNQSAQRDTYNCASSTNTLNIPEFKQELGKFKDALEKSGSTVIKEPLPTELTE